MESKRPRGRPRVPRDNTAKKGRGRPKKEIKDEIYINCINTTNNNDTSCFLTTINYNGTIINYNPLNNDGFTTNGDYIGTVEMP